MRNTSNKPHSKVCLPLERFQSTLRVTNVIKLLSFLLYFISTRLNDNLTPWTEFFLKNYASQMVEFPNKAVCNLKVYYCVNYINPFNILITYSF